MQRGDVISCVIDVSVFRITDSRAGAAIIGTIETIFVFCAHPISAIGGTRSAVGGATGTTFKVVCIFPF